MATHHVAKIDVDWKAIADEMVAELLAANANSQSPYISAAHQAAALRYDGFTDNQTWLSHQEDQYLA